MMLPKCGTPLLQIFRLSPRTPTTPTSPSPSSPASLPCYNVSPLRRNHLPAYAKKNTEDWRRDIPWDAEEWEEGDPRNGESEVERSRAPSTEAGYSSPNDPPPQLKI